MYDSLMVDYDNLLIGRTNRINADFFYGKDNATSNQYRALKCLRYVIEELLGWDAVTAINKFDNYIIRVLRLESIINYIPFPPEIPTNDTRYILSLLYPHYVKINVEKLVYNVLEQVKNRERKQFPREFFLGSKGYTRFCYCIKYIIEKDVVFSNISDIYDYFFSTNGRKKLSDYRLRIPAYQYNIDLKNIIYTLTYEEEDAELWYCYYRFLDELNALKNPSKKEVDMTEDEIKELKKLKKANSKPVKKNKTKKVSKNKTAEKMENTDAFSINVEKINEMSEEELIERINNFEKLEDDEDVLNAFMEMPLPDDENDEY